VKFEQQIMEASIIKERLLMHPSSVAMLKPDTGVEIKKKSAYYVIRDCATLANEYIPHKCYSSLDNPIQTLHGRFTREHIIDFVSRSKKHAATKQLLWIIFSDIYKLEADDWTPPEPVTTSHALEIDADADHDEIYGDYGYTEDVSSDVESELPVAPPIDLGDGDVVVDKLMEVFGVNTQDA
jgi:hypothetical protein